MEDGREPLERIADALEKLAADPPEIEVHAGPPVCPHCGQFDPEIEIGDTIATTGKLSAYLVVGKCLNCKKTMYGVIESYSMHKDVETVKIEMNSPERKAYLSGEPIGRN